MDGCLPNLIKYLLFATNFLVFVMACVVCGIAIYALVDGEALSSLLSSISTSEETFSLSIFTTAAVMLIVVSVFIMIITFFGCCGALKESRCMLGIYFTVILTLFIVLIVGAVIGYSETLDRVKKPLQDSIKKYDKDSQDKKIQAQTKAWDQVQTDFKCCGVESFEEWKDNAYLVGKELQVPESCCQRDDINGAAEVAACTTNPAGVTPKLDTCYGKFKASVEDNKTKFVVAAVIIVIVMFLNMIFAFAMCTMAT